MESSLPLTRQGLGQRRRAVASPAPRPGRAVQAGAEREQTKGAEQERQSAPGHCAPRQPDRPSPRPDPLWFGNHSAQGAGGGENAGRSAESAKESHGESRLNQAFSISTTPGQTPVRAWRAPGLNLCNWRPNSLVSGPYTFASGPLPGPKAPVLARVLPFPTGARGRACLSGSARPSGPTDGPGPQPSWFPRRLTRRHRQGVALHLDSVPRGMSR
jgi:hypothetical protein